MKSLSLFLFFPLLICGLLLGNAALTELVYDSSKTYSKGDAVIPSSTEFTLYTAKTAVPAGQNGPPNTAYWQTAEEYSTELQNTYSSTVSTPPSSDNINTSEIANLGTPDTSTPESTPLPSAGDSNSLLLDISTAGFVSPNAKMSGGFIIVGGTMEVLVTAKSSKENNVDTLNNPRLEVVPLARDKILASNNDWKSATNSNEISSTGFMSTSGDNDAAVLLTLDPGAYLADVFSEDSDSGGALVEVFDMNAVNGVSNGSKLLDISTNGTVLNGTNPGQKMTAGFIIFTGTSKRVLVTAKGSIESGVDPLNNPRLEVVPLARDKVSGSNNDWKSNDSTQVDAITTIGYMNNFKDTDAALILTLDAGAYLVDVFSEDSDSGKALVEVFDVDMLVNDFGIDID